jgi:hypothetical protein
VGKAEKVEGRSLLSPRFSPLYGQRSKLDTLGFLGGYFQAKLVKPLFHSLPEPHGISFCLKTGHKVVRIANKPCGTHAGFSKPSGKPQVKTVVQVNISEQWRNYAPLRGAPVTGSICTVFLYARFQEAFDIAQDAFVGDAVGQKCHQLVLVDIVVDGCQNPPISGCEIQLTIPRIIFPT